MSSSTSKRSKESVSGERKVRASFCISGHETPSSTSVSSKRGTIDMTETAEVTESGTLSVSLSVPNNFVNGLLFASPPENPTPTRAKARATKPQQRKFESLTSLDDSGLHDSSFSLPLNDDHRGDVTDHNKRLKLNDDDDDRQKLDDPRADHQLEHMSGGMGDNEGTSPMIIIEACDLEENSANETLDSLFNASTDIRERTFSEIEFENEVNGFAADFSRSYFDGLSVNDFPNTTWRFSPRDLEQMFETPIQFSEDIDAILQSGAKIEISTKSKPAECTVTSATMAPPENASVQDSGNSLVPIKNSPEGSTQNDSLSSKSKAGKAESTVTSATMVQDSGDQLVQIKKSPEGTMRNNSLSNKSKAGTNSKSVSGKVWNPDSPATVASATTAQIRTSPEETLQNISNNKTQAGKNSRSTSSATVRNPDFPATDRVQYGGKSLKMLKDVLIKSDPRAYSTENCQLIVSDGGTKVQTTSVSGQLQTTSNVAASKVSDQIASKGQSSKSSGVKAKKPMPKSRALQKQIRQNSDVTQRSDIRKQVAKAHVSKTLIQPSTVRSLVKRSPSWSPNRLFPASIEPGSSLFLSRDDRKITVLPRPKFVEKWILPKPGTLLPAPLHPFPLSSGSSSESDIQIRLFGKDVQASSFLRATSTPRRQVKQTGSFSVHSDSFSSGCTTRSQARGTKRKAEKEEKVIDPKVASKMSKDVGITRGHGLALKFANEMLRKFVFNVVDFIQVHCDEDATVEVTKDDIEFALRFSRLS